MASQVFVYLPLDGQQKLTVLNFDSGCANVAALEDILLRQFDISPSMYWLKLAGKAVQDRSAATMLTAAGAFPPTVHVNLRLVGGKGGFGSQLRAQGNKMSSKKRAGNYEACRDLSGRRLRTVNQAKIISDYAKGLPERERKKQAEIEAKMEKALEAPHKKVFFTDVEYLKTSREIVDDVESAVQEALHQKTREGPESSSSAGNDTAASSSSRQMSKSKEKQLESLGKEKTTVSGKKAKPSLSYWESEMMFSEEQQPIVPSREASSNGASSSKLVSARAR